MGGDEFTLLLPQTGRKGAEKICERIRNTCSNTSEDELPASIAVGYAIKEEVSQDRNDILSRADKHMYQHKPKGSRK